MQRTFGTRQKKRPEGYSARIVIPTMAVMDKWTDDGRFLASAGGGVVNLPAHISFMDSTPHGYSAAVIGGRLDFVTFNDDGTVSGEGWALADDNGRRMARMAKLGALSRNSVELRNVDFRVKFPTDEEIDAFFEEDEEGFSGPFPKILRRVDKWDIAGTTLVAIPAFEDADGVQVEDDEELELTASLEWTFDDFDAPWMDEQDELTAAMALRPSWDDFHRSEPDVHTPLTIFEDGSFVAHLGVWNECHRSMTDRCMMIPRSRDGYGSFRASSVLTDRGLVRTGPIALYRGHADKGLDYKALQKAYDDPKNAWGDAVIIDGKIGPWMCGRVRPGVAEEDVYVARASRISGHWLDGNLAGICSVNVPAFDVPYQFTERDGHGHLVASFDPADCGCDDDIDDRLERALALLGADD